VEDATSQLRSEHALVSHIGPVGDLGSGDVATAFEAASASTVTPFVEATIGFGRLIVSSEILVPRPPARITTCMLILSLAREEAR